jgi:hypothetical protein
LNEVYIEVDDVEEEDIDDVVSVEEALGVEEGIQVENLAGVITILGDNDADEEGNLDDNGSNFYYIFHKFFQELLAILGEC